MLQNSPFESEQKSIAKQHAQGKLTARERINLLVDHASFTEIGRLVTAYDAEQTHQKLYSDGVITGFATIQGRKVALFAQDFSIKGGSVGKRHAQKICALMDKAASIGCPLIGIIDSGGARITEGVHALAGYGEIFSRNVAYSGVIPQISVVVGPCAGGAVYSPALTDLIFTVEGLSQLFITGPHVIAQVTGEHISKEELGGTQAHMQKSGVIHFVSPHEQACFSLVRTTLGYLPSNYKEIPPAHPSSQQPAPSSLHTLPAHHAKGYDVTLLIRSLVDSESFLEVQSGFAPHIVIGFARLAGKSIGIVANQPHLKAGTIDREASCKAARFINLCNAFGIPLISLVDTPGYLPGVAEEHGGIIRHGAKLLQAYAQATIPKITLITRKAFGGAYIVMGSKHLGADFVFAWPQAQIAVLGAPSAVAILHRKELAQLEGEEQKTRRSLLEERYESKLLNPYRAAESGYIDDIITPEETRKKLIAALSITENKVHIPIAKKLANGPL